MNEHENRKRLNRILRDLSEELDVPPSKYLEAKAPMAECGVICD